MTYCLGIKLRSGLVFLSDSRTSAAVDQVGMFRKMLVYERPGDRFMVLLSAGNLSISQSVREILQVETVPSPSGSELLTIWTATSMFDAARVLGSALRRVNDQDGPALQRAGVDYGTSMIFGGQIRGEAPRLFLMYAPGNFIEATEETCYFQIGELKYGKPVLDRIITPHTPLHVAAKCALVSMDSTLKSNLSVGLPLDLAIYRAGSYASDEIVCIEEGNPYFSMIRGTWGQRLREVFDGIEEPELGGEASTIPLRVESERCSPLKKVTHPGDRIG